MRSPKWEVKRGSSTGDGPTKPKDHQFCSEDMGDASPVSDSLWPLSIAPLPLPVLHI